MQKVFLYHDQRKINGKEIHSFIKNMMAASKGLTDILLNKFVNLKDKDCFLFGNCYQRGNSPF